MTRWSRQPGATSMAGTGEPGVAYREGCVEMAREMDMRAGILPSAVGLDAINSV
ncbi:hypothetical protein L838_2962 [Mycobacterium avium MAV_120709_2344]|nr:hypothetical protein L838_2962 [Mycobacterium avium MAV_120709_2344]ETZ57482.1 hypothetical protein L840_3158 [Mycobacterium sp. MAC_011194_8550]ETZ58939.1 hypothetical protein L841_4985 [Mycobacterium sp. MAC_080597_8934]